MEHRSKNILLFALSVVLLLVVSARISPGEAVSSAAPGKIAEDVLLPPSPTPPGEDGAAAEEESAASASMKTRVRALFPDASPGDWNLRLVNNDYILPAVFAPELTEIRAGEFFDSRAADAREEMIAAATEQEFVTTVSIRMAYRSYQTQAYLFYSQVSLLAESQEIDYVEAEELARAAVAYPGASEHQTGLCIDLLDAGITSVTEEEAEELPLLLWLREHCAEYGFIYRYPKEKQEITGWYEPWHFRYVGRPAAEYIMENGLCLEEFIELLS